MPNLQTSPLAWLVSDTHFSHKQPSSRACPDWYAYQAGYLRDLMQLAGGCPVFFAGDFFDRWETPASLVAMLLDVIPPGLPWYAVPGQHDMQNHRYGSHLEGPYGCLVRAGRLRDMPPGEVVQVEGLEAVGYPWGTPLGPGPWTAPSPGYRLAVVHAYIWQEKRHTYKGGDRPECYAGTLGTALTGYSHAVFGDNHIPFQAKGPHGMQILNHGVAMPRTRADKAIYRRFWAMNGAGILHEVQVPRLEEWTPEVDAVEVAGLTVEAVSGLHALADPTTVFDFRQYLQHESLALRPALGTVVRGIVNDGD